MKETSFVPRSELNVREIFAQRAERLGYRIVESRAAFPDYLLEHEGERLLAEAEFRTSDFLRHRHDLARCDLVVVWEHNLPSMPIPVLELKTNSLHLSRRRGRPRATERSRFEEVRRRRAFFARRRARKASTDHGDGDAPDAAKVAPSEPL
jgi:hypothetical protein